MPTAIAPYSCRFCGAPSWREPNDQTLPPDYCHPEDHGEPDDYMPVEPTRN